MELFQKFIRKISTPFLLICTFFFLATQAGLAQAVARVGLLEDMQIRPGVAVEIPIAIEDVVDLYGIDVEIKFDPTFWEFEDADDRQAGIQPAIGTFLDSGMTLFNIIDMEEGRIQLVMSQMNPSEPKSGDGTIMVLYAMAKKTGLTSFEVTNVELSTRYGEAIAVEGVDGEVRIESQAPVVTATSIPVVDPTEIIVVPSSLPPTATSTPVATATPQPTQTSTEAPAATSVPTRTATNAPMATLAPTATQSQGAAVISEPTSAVEPEGEENLAADATSASPAEETLAAPAEQPDPEAEESALDEASNTDERLLQKDNPQGLGKLLPWLIGAAVLLIIVAGVYFSTRRKQGNQPDHTDSTGGNNE